LQHYKTPKVADAKHFIEIAGITKRCDSPSLAVIFNKYKISLVTDTEAKNYNTRGKKRKQSEIQESEIHNHKQKQNSKRSKKKTKNQKVDASEDSQSDSSDSVEKANEQTNTKEEKNKNQTTSKEELVLKKSKHVIANQKEQKGKDKLKEEAQNLSGLESNSEDEKEEDEFTNDNEEAFHIPEAQTKNKNTIQNKEEQNTLPNTVETSKNHDEDGSQPTTWDSCGWNWESVRNI
jgi:hypothetical protein